MTLKSSLILSGGALLVGLCFASTSHAQAFAGEDFDGGSTNGGFTATTMSFTPDNSAASPRGTFGTGIFDRFGVVNVADDNLPFGVVDESVDGFPADTAGFVSEFKTDDFVLSVDPDNGGNPGGAVSAEWTFDISGRSNLALSTDFGMLGDFEEADLYEFSYSIDGGPSALAFRIEGASGQFYSYTMDNGTFIDRVESGFFDDTEWEDVVNNGETPGVFEFHPRDTGEGDDMTARDGFVPVTFADGVEEVRAYTANPFDQEEFAPVKDPLVITSGDGTLDSDQLIADFATYTTALEGTGSTLTLTLNGVSNGGDEYFAFDNILLSEADAPVLAGDYNDDGVVNAADYTVWRDGGTLLNETASPGVVDEADYTAWSDNYGATGTAPAAVPEPASAVLIVLTLGGLFARRKN